MSNNIQNLANSIAKHGLQKANMYKIDILINNKLYSLTEYLLDLTLPGPKYQFYANTYWKGNWEYKQPVGIKYEDNLIMVFMVPSKNVNESGNLFNFLKENTSQFEFPKGTNQTGSFYWKGPNSNNTSGSKINIYPLNVNGKNTHGSYEYINCFVEKILPFKFAAESDPTYQTMSIVWTVGAEINKL